jgi:hypothetical protein
MIRIFLMQMLSRKWLAAAACFSVMVQPVFSEQADTKLVGIKRIYVETFPAKTGSGKLREDLIAELRRLGSPSIVSSESDADAILTGDGETWIKGYRSLNPRSGRLPSNGEPVYAGFLSVELKDTNGETIWSYLETLDPTSDNISKELAKQVVKRLLDALK